MQDLLPLGARLGSLLRDRRETVTVAESSTGGLISAALLSVPGASAYFLGGAVIYTAKARGTLLDVADSAMAGMRGATQEYAMLMARTVRERFGANWSIAESGATGPTGNRYGDPAGHTCIAVGGAVELSKTIETGSNDRVANMRAFTAAALELLVQALAAAPRARS